MKDPWAGARAAVDIPIANAEAMQLELERLLLDADALLGGARYVRELIGLLAYVSDHPSEYEQWTEARAWYAALPEYLK